MPRPYDLNIRLQPLQTLDTSSHSPNMRPAGITAPGFLRRHVALASSHQARRNTPCSSRKDKAEILRATEGSFSPTAMLAEQMLTSDAEGIIRKTIDKAKDGNGAALRRI